MGTDDTRCAARARHRKTRYGEPHTFPCQKPAGHEGGHEYREDGRTVIWFGESQPPDNTRLRFGKWLEER